MSWQSSCGVIISAAAIALGFAAALMRWSAWWPHRDIRQRWADVFTFIGLVAGLASLFVGMSLLEQRRHRMIALVLAAAVSAIVAAVGFDRLIDATIGDR